jgi:hypothetical protein
MSTLNACTMSNPRFSATNCKLRNDIINRRCEIKYGARQKMDEHIFGPAALPRARSTAPVVTWNKSKARRLLERDLATGAIPVCGREMGTRLVYASRPEYATYTLELFTRRLASMRKTAKGQTMMLRRMHMILHCDHKLHTTLMAFHDGKDPMRNDCLKKTLQLAYIHRWHLRCCSRRVWNTINASHWRNFGVTSRRKSNCANSGQVIMDDRCNLCYVLNNGEPVSN